MVVKRKIVAAYQEELRCDECGGQMTFTGESYLTYPAQYVHKCKNCGNKTTILGETYPKVSYVVEGEEDENSEGT